MSFVLQSFFFIICSTERGKHNFSYTSFFLRVICPIFYLSYSLFVLFFICLILYLSYSLFVLFLICPILYLCYSLFVLFFICPILFLCYSLFVLFFICPILYLSDSSFVLGIERKAVSTNSCRTNSKAPSNFKRSSPLKSWQTGVYRVNKTEQDNQRQLYRF